MTDQQNLIAESFSNIHAIITRGLKNSLESLKQIEVDRLDENTLPKGLFLYMHALASVLNSHHLTEDEIAFPYFRDLLPRAPFDSLSMDHKEMVKHLGIMNNTLDKCERNEQPGVNLKSLEYAIIMLNEIWTPHIGVEMDEFIVNADAILPLEERVRLVGAFAEHGVKNATPHPITVPFLLFNLPPPQRAAFSQGMPAEVVQHLVPVVWKTQWEAMLPYLLE